MSPASIGIGLAGLVVFGAILLFTVGLALWALAKQDILFTLVEEGRAKAIMYNGAFWKVVMSYHDRIFRGDLPSGHREALTPRSEPEDFWDIANDPAPFRRHKLRIPFLRNIYYIGVPPFSKVHSYRFEWTSLEEEPRDDGSLHKVHKWKNLEKAEHILVQADTYVSTISAAECSDKIPLDCVFIINGEIVNPYKALFKVQKWLESTQNLVAASLRDYIGMTSYEALLSSITPDGNDVLFAATTAIRAQILRDFGFRITSLRFESVEASGELANDFIRATTRVVVAENQAKADKIEGQGKADRATAYYRAVADIPGGTTMLVAEAIRDSKLTTFVNGQASGLVLNPQQPAPTQPGGTP